MKGDYPGFKVTYTDEELAEHFLLTPAERALVETCRGDVNRHGIAVLLKAVQYLGYFPAELSQVPWGSVPSLRTSSSFYGTTRPPIPVIPAHGMCMWP